MTMRTASESFKEHLNLEYQKRVVEHGKYSLRAFAHSLGIDAPSLHHIMKGERRVGPKLIRRLGEKLGLSAEVIKAMVDRK
jgi:plasmid maintenance system antidote protein VapI